MNLILIGIGLLVLSGCCSFCPEKIKEVYINNGCATPAVVIAPTLKTISLTKDSTSKDVIEAYVLDVDTLKLYSNQLSKALEPYQSCQNK